MHIFNDLSNLPKVENTILTLGIFDGVHLGHKKIFEKLKKKAENLSRKFEKKLLDILLLVLG